MLYTPQIEPGIVFLAFAKMAGASFRSPWTSKIFGDVFLSSCAAGELGFRVTARIVKSDLACNRLFTTAPPCFPVAPVIRTARDMLLGCFKDQESKMTPHNL